jgi:signal transduction histidine kinase
MDLADTFRSAIERGGIKFTVNCEPTAEPIYVDREMWEKITFNLLSNAYKYTLKGEITLSLRALGKGVELSVTDTGAGIREEDLPKIFQRFYRGQTTQARTGEGTGIGLSFVQELVKLHKGEISIKSIFGQGSTFTVVIPFGLNSSRIRERINEASREGDLSREVLNWNEESETAPPSTPEPRIESFNQTTDVRRTVLLVDDNADMRNYIFALLSPYYQVGLARDGEEAWSQLEEKLPDLVLSDLMMPKLDGIGLLKQIRGTPRTQNIPVILMSARTEIKSKLEGLNMGANDYLTKPFDRSELIARVRVNVDLIRLKELDRVNLLLVQKKNSLEQFVHAAAHDLREPTKRISLLIDLFISDFETTLNEESLLRLAGLKIHASRLDQLISGLQYITEVDSVSLNIKDVSIGSVVASVFKGFQDEIARQKIKVFVGPLPQLVGYEILLIQLFKNLISNAIKHGSTGTSIDVTNELAIDPEYTVICVRNTGSSLTKTQCDKVFLPFKRFSSKEGTGIGLYICKKIVEAHNGTIWAESGENWTEFKIKIPKTSLISPDDTSGNPS